MFLLGVIILRENARQRINLVVSAMLFFGGLGSIIGALGLLASLSGPDFEETFASRDFFQNLAYIWEFFFPALLLFATVFPTERAIAKRFRGYTLLVFVPHVFHFLLLVGLGWFMPTLTNSSLSVPSLVQPVVQVLGWLATIFLGIHQALFSLVNLVYVGATAFFLLANYRDTTEPRIRQQIRVIGLGLFVCLVLYSGATLVPTLFGIQLELWLSTLMTSTALLACSGAITYSIVRHKFLDTKLFARQAIVYAISSALLVGFYLAVVVQLNRFFTQVTGLDSEVIEPVLLILALILFQPAVSRLGETLEHLFLRDPADYRNILKQLGRETLTTIDLDLLLARSIRTIGDALTLKSAYIVALAREAPLMHVGRGDHIPEPLVAQLPEIINRLPSTAQSFRISEMAPIDERDRDFLRSVFDARLVIALRTKGETVGALILGPKVAGTEYTSEDVSLLTTLADQLSVSLQNGLLLRDRVAVARFEEELNLARQIQRSFLPSSFPDVDGIDIHGTSIPSKEVGGDLYDVVPLENDCFLIAIGDVSGKGVPAALLSSMLQASLRTQAGSVKSVSEIMKNINNLVYKSTRLEQFATFFIALINCESMEISFSNAGHNFPILIRSNGDVVELSQGGLILGIMEGVTFEEHSIKLESGDRAIFFTDGISEALNEEDEEFGEERLNTLVSTLPKDAEAQEVTEELLADLYGFLGDREAQDDVTLMVLKVMEKARNVNPSPILDRV
ncbi:MAG: SpoIIE family protein phosphatase [Candidatus Eisenbacteria bacterium]|uniref:SpoIIE family protein phosphatase n=1 Tax=Eiseniibacteriota bacterium TaxID=2212470 RepID=A0A7Y2H254_UNCEI|nr:SpoIIE family protein phosphatase [Candidatus Eisenbacteria bacterium]